jgi:hypothetical protein
LYYIISSLLINIDIVHCAGPEDISDAVKKIAEVKGDVYNTVNINGAKIKVDSINTGL